jgi:hypothetical protein
MKKKFVLCAFFLTLSLFSQNKIPQELEPWIGWATWDSEKSFCPTIYNSSTKHFCVWPSSLNLNISKHKGTFSQTVTVFAESHVYLPGNTTTWPFNVTVNGKEIPVVEQNNTPSIKLSKGTYSINGEFFWHSIPNSIKIPASTGIVTLRIKNKNILFPKRNSKGFLQLTNLKSVKRNKDYLSHKVFFLLEDGIPLKLQIIVKLTVSGQSREVNLNTVIPLNFKVESITSDIPATIDTEKKLIVQVRTGKWTIKINTFCLNNISLIQFPPNIPLIAESSFLAVKTDQSFRVLEVKAGTLTDPSETSVPQQWKTFPVFFWNLKTPAKLIEQQRGNIQKENKSFLTLKRNLWLNENGNDYTFQDKITGTINSITRIDANSKIIPGKISLNGKNLLITENPFTKNKGVELRNSNINLKAVGKIKAKGEIPISGWEKNIDKVFITINLPPGYKVFALLGADKSYGDWLSSWNLLDIFLLLVFSIAMYRLWGFKAGIITFIGFAIMYHEPGAPKFIWFALLIPVALLNVIKEGTAHQLLTYAKYLALFFFILIVTPFIAKQAQLIIYPQLEKHINISLPYNSNLQTKATKPLKKEKTSRKVIQSLQHYDKNNNNLYYNPSAKVQTGPGIPLWHWEKASCNWSRIVETNETFNPVLIPPLLTKLLYILRIIFVILILSIMFNITLPVKSGKLLILLLFLLSGTTTKATIPDKDTLNLLKSRVLKQADCYPHCGEIEWLTITISNNLISYNAKVHTETLTAIPLPGLINSLAPLSATVNNLPAPLRKGDKYLFVALKKGIHIVKVTSAIPEKDSFNLSFELVPKKVTIKAPEWNFSGVSNNFKVDKQIFFTRKQIVKTKKNKSYSFESENPLVVVIRKIELGQSWQVTTTVKRYSITKQPLAVTIPLLENEKPLSPDIKVSKQRTVTIKLASGQKEYRLKGELPFSNRLNFISNENNIYTEQWIVLQSPAWNVQYEGLPPLYSLENNNIVPVWKPWPGEKLTLTICKPQPIKGQTVTVTKVNYKGIPAANTSSYILTFTVESSTGGNFTLKLPTDAKVTSVERNKESIVAKVKNSIITIPLLPSKQDIAVEFSTKKGVTLKTQMAKIEFSKSATNIFLNLKVPYNRWILFTNGPLMGPAVRFWGLFILMLISAFILGSLKNSPLTKGEWLLLTVGLSQIPIFLSLIVIIWLFWLKWRGEFDISKMPNLAFNLQQLALVGITVITLFIFLAIVYEGLTGRPEMYIVGNNSTIGNLQWYKGEINKILPQPYFISVSIWVYRFIMLLWALWLSNSLIKWLKWGFKQFGKDKYWI